LSLGDTAHAKPEHATSTLTGGVDRLTRFVECENELLVIVGWRVHHVAVDAPMTANADRAEFVRMFVAEVLVSPMVNLDGWSLVTNLTPMAAEFEMLATAALPFGRDDVAKITVGRCRMDDVGQEFARV
jgi:hypothetical protein